MILVIFGVSVLFLILLVILTKKDYFTLGILSLYLLFGITAGASIIIFLIGISVVMPVNERVIDEKIAMYQEENTRIEESIDAMVAQYMQYETETFGNVADGANPIAYVSLFPELKSDSLVKNQIDIYYSNAEKIKALKVQKIEISNTRWLLYLGN